MTMTIVTATSTAASTATILMLSDLTDYYSYEYYSYYTYNNDISDISTYEFHFYISLLSIANSDMSKESSSYLFLRKSKYSAINMKAMANIVPIPNPLPDTNIPI